MLTCVTNGDFDSGEAGNESGRSGDAFVFSHHVNQRSEHLCVCLFMPVDLYLCGIKTCLNPKEL